MAAPALRSPSIRSNNSEDPFNNATPPTSNGSSRGQHRYSSFDTKLFSQYSERASPTLAKRNDGTVQEQKYETPERPRNGDRPAPGPDEHGSELRQRLANLEQDYNEIGRETARLSPRKANYDAGDQATEGGFSAGANRLNSPTKPRVQRNGPSGRVHDIEFATEISTSLLAQLRHLQGVLAEREEALRQAHDDNARLQQTSDRFDHRLRELDATEQRYKEQTWQLESQVQDLSYQVKDAQVREQRLTQHLNAAKTGRSTAEREYDELRQQHDQLSEEHHTLRKSHEGEIFNMQRALTSGDGERESLNQKIEELLSHNQQMEREFHERLQAAETARDGDMMGDRDMLGFDRPVTPDGMGSHSPVKATPRVGALEAETLKSSLNHAHRMIQNLKNNIHREKTEKQELKRMLQDARDELEARKADVGGVNPAAVKRRKQAGPELKKSMARLGGAGGAREEIINDPTWEEYEDSPTRPRAAGRKDNFDLATDTSDAFETANEGGTDTEGFQTAQDSDGDLTETESPTMKRQRLQAITLRRQMSSMESTASDDEGDDMYDLSTPPSHGTGYRSQLERVGNTSALRDSPQSFVSHSSQRGQNLAAELDDFDDSSVAETTPGQRSFGSRGASPESEGVATPVPMRKASLVRTSSRPAMVHSGMMTEPWHPQMEASKAVAPVSPETSEELTSATMDDGPPTLQIPEVDLSKRRSFDPSMAPSPLSPSPRSVSPNPHSPGGAVPALNLAMSPIQSQHIEPVAPVIATSAPAIVNTTRDIVQGQTLSAPVVKQGEGAEPSPVSMNGHNEPVSAMATPMDEANHSSMDFVHNILKQPPVPLNGEKSSTEMPRVRDFALEQKPTFDGRDANKVLLEPRMRASREQAPDSQQSQDPTLQAATPMNEDPRKSVLSLPYVPSTTAQKGKSRAPMMSSAGTQTVVSADQIDNLLKDRRKSMGNQPPPPVIVGIPGAPKGVNDGRTMSLGSVNGRPDAAAFLQNTSRPGSSGSSRRGTSPPPGQMPPLPADHKEVIAAAARGTGPTNMPPPNMMPPPPNLMMPPPNLAGQPIPPSAWRPPSASRNRAPSGTFAHSPSRQPTTPRHSSQVRSEYGTPATRRSSVSSFQSELDERFGMTPRHYMGGDGFEIAPNTDPRMIQAITQTMIGEFLWKYTRKAGRSGEHSENRHKRFFWIHPYTRTLYWSNQDPSLPNQKELKAKSVAIEAVRVVSDENSIPAGLHTKSLVVVTPGRSIKFTAPTIQRHETWFNALSYLLLRKDPATADETTAAVHGSTPSKSSSAQDRSNTMSSSNYTPEDIAEFNPSYSRSASASRMTNASSRSLGNSIPATPRTTQQSSLGARTASPQRSTPQQASLAARQSSAARLQKPHPGSMGPPLVNNMGPPGMNNASVSSNTINSIAEDRPLSSGGMTYRASNMPNNPGNSVHMQQNTNSSQSTFDKSPAKSAYADFQGRDGAADPPDSRDGDDGFKKPRPMSGMTTETVRSGRESRSSRLGSMTGGWRASLFGRGRSKSRGRAGAPDSEPGQFGTSSVNGAGSGSNYAGSRASVGSRGHVDGAKEVPMPPLPTGGWGQGSFVGGVENVRACCDGKHDVGSLDHHHHTVTKGRLGSRSRSRPGSSSSRYNNGGGGGGSMSSRY